MILDQLKAKQIEYMKAKDEFRLGALRYFLSEVKNKEIELRPQNIVLDDELVFKVLKKQLKNRKQTLEMFTNAKRDDLVSKEKLEIGFLEDLAKMFPFEL